MRTRFLFALALLSPAAAAAQGAIVGVVRDEGGVPLADVRISIDSGRRAVLTARDGRFQLLAVAAGAQTLAARKIGYLPASARLTVPDDSAVTVDIVLIRDAMRLPGVVVDADIKNRVGGVVIDRKNQPISGVVVDVIGLNMRVETGEDGRFAFLDLDPGLYLVQWRKKGYEVAQFSVRIVHDLDRDLAVRMYLADNERYTPELAAVVALEATRRQGMAGGRATIVGRDELERWEEAPLGVALNGSSGAIALREAGLSCVIVNGHDVLNATTERTRTSTRRRGPTSAVAGPPRPEPISAAAGGGWLAYFRADEVEMVEIYPEGSENSRTLCARFRPSSGCSCPPEPAGVVIWLK